MKADVKLLCTVTKKAIIIKEIESDLVDYTNIAKVSDAIMMRRISLTFKKCGTSRVLSITENEKEKDIVLLGTIQTEVDEDSVYGIIVIDEASEYFGYKMLELREPIKIRMNLE